MRELRARGLTAREVGAMVEHMPAGTPAWGQLHEVVASVHDVLERLIYVTQVFNVDKKYRSKIKPPAVFPRPGRARGSRLRGETLAKSTRSFASPAEFDAWRASRLRPALPAPQ